MDNIPLYLVGIMQHFLSSRLPTFGTKFGQSVVALPLVCYFRLKSTLKEDSSMKSVASSGVNVTLDVKISPTLCHTLVLKSFGSKLRESPSPLEVLLRILLTSSLMVAVIVLRFQIFSHLNLSRFSTLALNHILAAAFTAALISQLLLLSSPPFSSLKRLSVILYLNLSLVSVMVQTRCQITLSMPKKIYVIPSQSFFQLCSAMVLFLTHFVIAF